jgi:glycosyltransferase involved in cell wall biosynthesis
MLRLLIIGTHPSQTTGYSRVVYNIAKHLEKYTQLQLRTTIYGIQRFNNVNDSYRLDLPKNVAVWDVYAHDKNDYGFGSGFLGNFVCINDPDIIVIYNDSEVIKKYIMNLQLIKQSSDYKSMGRDFKIVAYLDQVHTNHNLETIKYIYENTSHVFCFTEYWKQNYLTYFEGDNKSIANLKSSVVRHGIKLPELKETSQECKEYFNFPKDSFIFLNLNRYATKKRLDISVIAFVKFLKSTNAKDAYLYFPAITDKDFSSLQTIYSMECKLNSLDIPNRLIIGNKLLSDDEINKIYMACDVGLNSCDGEGFGLCNYEHASYGKPQIVSKVGGLQDYFNESNSLVCVPKYVSYSNDNERGEIIDSVDMAEKMAKYYISKSLYNKHSKLSREIPEKYKWETEVDHMVKVLLSL